MIKKVKGDIQIGHTDVRGGAARDREVSEKHVFETEIDHKRFGFRLAEPLLVAAFGVIRACFPTGERFDNLILHEMSKVITKFLLLPGGWVYRWTFGNPSGPWTSILDSICNWLACSAALNTLGVPPKERTLWIYGDDTLIGWKTGRSARTAEEVQDVLQHRFAILKGDSQNGKLSRYGVAVPGVTFLSSWHKDGLFGRPLAKWLDVSCLPEKRRESLSSQLGRMSYLDSAAWLTDDNSWYFYHYFNWINRQFPASIQFKPHVLDTVLTRKWGIAHRRFTSGQDDTRVWELGGNTRLNTLQGGPWNFNPMRNPSPGSPEHPLALSWLCRGNCEDGYPSILGFNEISLDSRPFMPVYERASVLLRLR
jgi:hypothetical protein